MTFAQRLVAVVLVCVIGNPLQAEKLFLRANDLSFCGAESLDPLSPNRFYEVNDLIYSRLVRQDDAGQPSPELATSWTSNADATEWTLTLQPGVTFHDGSAFDAADVAYSLTRIEDPELESPVSAVLGFIDRVEVIDPMTVKILLESPHAGLPILLLDYRVRMIPDGAGPTIEDNPIGTGPFKVESFDPEGTTRLVANENYWEGRPLLDAIQFTAIPDSEARNQAMLAGQLDLNTITRDQVASYADDPAFQVQSFPSGGWFGIVFRTDTAPFDNPLVRRALRIAVDRQAMMTLMVGETGGTVGCDTPVRADDPFRANLDCPQDIEGAKALLAEAGYPDGIDIELVTTDLEPGMVRFAEVYQAQVAPAGIRVSLKLAPADGYWDDVWMTAPASVTSWGERPADQILNETWRTGSSWNESYYANAAYDQLLDQARASLDETASRALYVQAQELLFQDGGTFIPNQENSCQVLSARVRGIPAVGEDYLRWHLVDLVE